MPANKDFLPDMMDTDNVKQRAQPIIRVDGEGDSPSHVQAMMEGQQRLEKQTRELTQRMMAQQNLMASQQKLEKQLEMLSKHLADASPPPASGRPKAGNKQSVQQQLEREVHSSDYEDGCDAEQDQRHGNKRNRARELRGHAGEDGYDVGDTYHHAHKSPSAKEMRGLAFQDRHDFHESPQHGRKRVQYKEGHEEDSDDEEKSAHGNHQGHDNHERHDDRHVTSFQRLALRKISLRRDNTMAQLHGDSALHMAAWIAEVITCFLFTCACVIMLSLWARHINEEAFVNTSFVTAIAAMTYFAKACHMGDMMLMGHVVPLARYIDWITTTPLMLYEVCHIAHATASMTIMVIVCDLLMLATGIIAALIPWKKHKGLKQVWFGLSCFFYILMLVVIQTDVAYKAKKQIPVAANLFKQLKYLTIIIWSFYPVIVAMGRAHLGLITKPTEDILLCILDVTAKIGMEGLIVGSCFDGCIAAGGDH